MSRPFRLSEQSCESPWTVSLEDSMPQFHVYRLIYIAQLSRLTTGCIYYECQYCEWSF